ncbi:MAG: HAD-IA family hydrolase [Legionellaceae bacterium]|nr:HAD-IA family hydrolase [Legionellaceae bacterium]
MSKKNIIFDFDGTITDSLTKVFEIMNLLAKDYGFDKVSIEDLPRLQQMSAKEILNHLKVKTWQIPILMFKVRKMLNCEMQNLKLHAVLDNVFAILPDYYNSIGILSSNSKNNIQSFLSGNNIKQFDYIVTEKLRLSKHRKLSRLIKKNGFLTEDTCYIGDEVRDVEAAKVAKITSIAVSWGYNSKSALERSKPDYLASSTEELQNILIDLSK